MSVPVRINGAPWAGVVAYWDANAQFPGDAAHRMRPPDWYELPAVGAPGWWVWAPANLLNSYERTMGAKTPILGRVVNGGEQASENLGRTWVTLGAVAASVSGSWGDGDADQRSESEKQAAGPFAVVAVAAVAAGIWLALR